ncbi:MAG: hypothetical protein AAGJ80_00065 [Cyanobacteria bacterium J06553_1]
MQPTTLLKPLKNETTPQAKTLVVIDLGNGQVQALIRLPGAAKFERVSFPSYVAETEQSNSDCLRIVSGKALKAYLVGEHAAAVPMSHTGLDENGKAANAKLLVLHALRLAFGDEIKAIHCDVIFTSPSNKAYGSDISKQLQDVHPVTIPADAEVIGSEAKTYTVVIHRAIPLLEGHYAFTALKLKGDAWILDVGNRTLIATKVSSKGRILKRDYFGGCGVRGLAERITARESLSAQMKEHTPEKVIDFLFSGEDVSEAIAADVSACIAETLAFIGDDDSPRHLIGGGAGIPGMAGALGGKVAKNSQWINIQSLADASQQILEA